MTDVLQIEEMAFRAWPALEVEDVAAFRVRHTGSVTRRANSTWSVAAPSADPLVNRVVAVERFYDARRASASFQIVEGLSPDGLDALLEARDYELDAPTAILAAPLGAFRFPGQPPQLMTRVHAAPDEDWAHVSVDRGRFAASKEAYLGILRRIPDEAGFAVARRAGKPIAIGLGVRNGDWLGIFNMATLPEERRQYAATAVLAALVGWASARGATRAYLQVEADNEPAVALYSRSGFTPRYSYHYRTRPPPGSPSAPP